MKLIRILLVFAVLFTAAATNSHAQELGLRFGDAMANKSSIAIDAVFSVGKFSRVHGDVSFGNGVGVELLWDFLYRPIEKSPFNWYVGVGPSMFMGSPFGLGAAGEIGVEYRFKDAPIALGLDYRPTLVLIEKTTFVNAFGFNARYVF